MNAMLERLGIITLLGLGLIGCAPLNRFEATESLATKTATELGAVQEEEMRRYAQLQNDLARLEKQLEGASTAIIRVPGGMVPTTIFGNHSGHNVAATVTHRANDFKGPGTTIRIVRVKRPRDALVPLTPSSASEPNSGGTESTVWLELSSAGSRRQLVVPCGYQVEAMSPQGAVIDLMLKYQNKECL